MSKYWSQEKPADIWKPIWEIFGYLENKYKQREVGYKRALEAYLDRPIHGLQPGQWRSNPAPLDDTLTYNVFRSCSDTIKSKITQIMIQPKVTTFGGSEDDQAKARGLEKLILGVMQSQKMYPTGRTIFADSTQAGYGAFVFGHDGTKITAQRVNPNNIFIDDDTALNGETCTVFRREWYTQEELIAAYPKKAKAIMGISPERIVLDRNLVAELYQTIEVHKKTIGKNIGKHCVVIQNETLLCEDWHDELPYAFFRWNPPFYGWHGDSLYNELKGIQDEINYWLEIVRRSARLNSIPYLLVPVGSEINDGSIETNELGRIIEYTGDKAPNLETPDAISPQIFAWIDQLYQRAYEITGISLLSATSRKPAGLESGAALREYSDIETVRFSSISRTWEEFWVKCGELIVEAGKRLAKTNSNWKVNVIGKDMTMSQIEWSEVDMKQDRFKIMVQPASALPQSPSARLQSVLELAKDQLITRDEFMALADMPDLEKFNRLQTSEYEYLEMIFEEMLKDGAEYVAPIPYSNLTLGLKLCAQYYMRAMIAKQPEEKVDNLLRWMDEARELLLPATQLMPAAPMEAGQQIQPQPAPAAAGAPQQQAPMGPEGM